MTGARKTGGGSVPKFSVFRAQDAVDLDENMMQSDVSEKELAPIVKAMSAGLSDGAVTRKLFGDDDAGISLVYAWFKPNYPLGRHSHDSDCLYYLISGEIKLGTERLRAGDGFFVPADGLYGYRVGPEGAEVLEFRTATKFNLKVKTAAAFWEKVSPIIAQNAPNWRTMEPPLIARRQAGLE